MKLFIDSANLEEIKRANEWRIIDGVTTNPTLITKEKNKNFEKTVQEIIDIVNGPINIEIMSTEIEEMVKEAVKLSELSKNVVIKIPITHKGLETVRILNDKKIKTNVTLVFSVNQALLAAKAGSTYVSIFIGRLDDIGHDSIQIVKDTVYIFNIYNFETKIIVASIRHPLHVIESAKVGAHIATVPFNVIEKMFHHPLTDIGIERFLKDWKSVRYDL